MLRDFGSYCDEFGHPDDPNKKYMGIAGLLAWSDHWKTFTDEWEECLRVEHIPRPFHMSDFVHHSEKFSAMRWENQDERNRVLGLLLRIIERVDVIPIGAAVSLKDYNGLTPEQQSKCRSPYYLAFQAVTSNMGFAAASIDLSLGIKRAEEDMKREEVGLPITDLNEYLAPSSVSMVYAKLRGFTGPAEELWNTIKSLNMFGRWMSSYTRGEPIDYPPLQAADIWAYSLGHMGEQDSPKIEASTAFTMFAGLQLKAAHGHHGFTFLDRRQILMNIGEFPNDKAI